MKKIWIAGLAFTLLILSACASVPDTAGLATPEPSATPAPDYSGSDFSGSWYVYTIIDSNGTPVSDEKMDQLDAGFILELLPGGGYFVYDEEGMALGQGEYAVTHDRLTLTAGDDHTVYEILDADTLSAVRPDESVTVMKRVSATCADTEPEKPDAAEDTGDTSSE